MAIKNGGRGTEGGDRERTERQVILSFLFYDPILTYARRNFNSVSKEEEEHLFLYGVRRSEERKEEGKKSNNSCSKSKSKLVHLSQVRENRTPPVLLSSLREEKPLKTSFHRINHILAG